MAEETRAFEEIMKEVSVLGVGILSCRFEWLFLSKSQESVWEYGSELFFCFFLARAP